MTAQTLDFQISDELRRDLRKWRALALPVGVIGLLASLIGMFLGRPYVDQFYQSYLWSYLFVLGLALGPLAWLMLQYLTGGAWGMVIRRPCEAALRTMPLVALLFLPIVIGIPNLYGWSHAANVAASPVLQHKHAYLNVPFFLARAAFYFSGWLLLCWHYNRVSRREDTEGHDAVHGSMSTPAGPGLIFWCFTTTFMSIDWILSIHPEFFSTMFGLLFIAGQGLTGMAFLITVMVLLSARRPMSEVLTARHLHDLGKFLLAMVMVWAYFSFSQFLIIWTGNLPEEIPYYLVRTNGGWGFLALVLVFGHFALPFALLLSRDLKRNFKLLASIAVFVLCMRLVDLFWVVTPEFRGHFFGISWMDITMPAGLIGLWLAYFLYQLERRPLMPLNNPHLEEALQHGRE
ncbi:MAG TPA: hypothetical protein VHW09_25630 [Bryobacteraceae bacterium]|jgi:hypothetical protein|nr:hypothetical protein [Bryobacteraceae bacterium]